MSKEELIKEKEKLNSDVERLKKIVEASSDTTFDIIIEDLKKHMIDNIELEEWSTLKTNLKEVSAVNTTKTFLENQSKLLTKKQTELLELENKINNYQIGLFEQLNGKKKKQTGIKFNDKELETGDFFELPNKTYLLIRESELEPDKFVITGTAFEEALLLQYPKNREVLNDSVFLGNIYEKEELFNFLHKLESEKENEAASDDTPEEPEKPEEDDN